MSRFLNVALHVLCTCVVLMSFTSGLFGQEKNITVKGTLKGLDAVQVVILTTDRDQSPREVVAGVVDKGKFEVSFKAVPSGWRYFVYIPALDTESHSNKRSSEFFFLDSTVINVVAKVKGDVFQEFDVPSSKMYRDFKLAKSKVNYEPYRKLGELHNQALQNWSDFLMKKNEEYQGAAYSEADSAKFKELLTLNNQSAKDFFEAEFQLGFQALDQVDGRVNSKGLNALVYDHFRGCNEGGLQPVVDKYTKEFGEEYMKQDFYLNMLYFDYQRQTMDRKGAPVVDFALLDLKGKDVHLSDFKGKYIYINCWDMEDPDYQTQETAMESLREKFANRKDIVFINLSTNQDPELWKSLISNKKLKSIQWSANPKEGKIFYKAYNLREFPRAILIDKNLKMQEFFMGVPSNPETESYLNALLK